MLRRRTRAWIAAAVALILPLLLMAQQPARISITTGGTGGVYYPMGGGMANVLALLRHSGVPPPRTNRSNPCRSAGVS